MSLNSKPNLDEVIAALRTVIDPDLHVNIYDMGFVYRIDISDAGDIEIDFTLTSPACPLAGQFPLMVEDAVTSVAKGGAVIVNLVWDPPWSLDKMRDEARYQLDLM